MTARSTTILIADDQPQMRRLIRRFCGGVSGQFHEASDGSEAVAAFQKHHPNWTLMDIEMPRLDGFAAARAIRKLDSQARIVFVSQHDSLEMREAARAAGAAAFVSKESLGDLTDLLLGETPNPV